MKNLLILLFLLGSFSTFAKSSSKKDAVVFLHGFMGWGPRDISVYHYWGGKHDIIKSLKDEGYNAFEASVSPIGSNWDRACELYAYLFGGRVDYGEVHSSMNHHKRYGPTYKGILNKNNYSGNIHIISHSMGGQTARLFASIMRDGDRFEKVFSKKNRFFKGNNRSVKSVVTLATPHNGTSIAPFVNLWMFKTSLQIPLYMGFGKDYDGFDFKISQWGVKREKGETLEHYIDRVAESRMLKGLDSSMWDLSIDGAKALNKRTSMAKGTKYYSVTNQASAKWGSISRPNFSTHPVFMTSSFLIGSLSTKDSGIDVDKSWRPNDGLVNVSSMYAPTIGKGDKYFEYKGNARTDGWNHLIHLDDWDHLDVVGIGTDKKIEDIIGLYKKILSTILQ